MNIQFTHELENNGSLSFLDINITRTNGRFSTSACVSQTYLNRILYKL